MGFPLYVVNLPNTTSQEQIIAKLKQYGDIWNESTRCFKQKFCFTIQVSYKKQQYAKRAITEFPISRYKKAKIYERQVCWACQQKNQKKTHLKKCPKNPLNTTTLYDSPIETSEKVENDKRNRKFIVSQTFNINIGVSSIKNIYAEEKTPQEKNSLIFINKDNQRIHVKIEPHIEISEMCFLGDQYGSMMKIVKINEPEVQVDAKVSHENKGQLTNRKQVKANDFDRWQKGQEMHLNNSQKQSNVEEKDQSSKMAESSLESIQRYQKKNKPKKNVQTRAPFKKTNNAALFSEMKVEDLVPHSEWPTQLSHPQIPTKSEFEKPLRQQDKSCKIMQIESFQEYQNEQSNTESNGLQEIMRKLNNSTLSRAK